MIIRKILSKIDISNLRFKRSPEKEKEKPSLISPMVLSQEGDSRKQQKKTP